MPKKETKFDVIISGAGPAGSACATFLARKGIKVLVLDKARFPRDKTCGDAISGKSVSVIRELGLEKEIEKNYHAKIYGVTLSSPNGNMFTVDIPERQGLKSYGYCARREVFDNIVFQTASKEKNVTIMQRTQVTGLRIEGNVVKGITATSLENNEALEFDAKIVVGADGAHSPVASALGVNKVENEHYCTAVRAYYEGIGGLTDKIEIHFIDEVMPGYFWIFPLENGMANVGVGMLFSDLKKRNINLKHAMHNAMHNNALFKKRFANAKQAGEIKGWTLPLGSKRRKLAFNGAVLLGDAGSLIDPFSGEGVGNALTSAKLAAPVIEKALRTNDFSENTFKEYEENVWKELGPELETSYKMQRLGRYKWLLNFTIGKAARKKELRDLIAHSLVQEGAMKNLVSPLGLIRMFFL
ncbi:MAG: geranylgeranyl reductase family protein [Candidatus Diapherotrites archaeon]|nr:geranylgeranyl reductase family protein [Candidatus Diapherotrites archaeon]